MNGRACTCFAFAICALVLLAVGCGDDGPDATDLQHLDLPAVIWTQDNGLCSRITVLDAHDAVWIDTGCERPIVLHRSGMASADQRSQIRSRVEALPLGDAPVGATCSDGLAHSFELKQAAGAARDARACSTSREYGATAGLPDAFVQAVEAFLAAPGT